jgi:hypothetical protein
VTTLWLQIMGDSQQRQQIFLFSETSRPALGPNLPYIQLVQSSFYAVKQLAHEPDHFSDTIAEVRNKWRCTSNRTLYLPVVGKENSSCVFVVVG